MRRALVEDVLSRFAKPPNLLQIVVGPRQVGKTTAARQIGSAWNGPVRYAAADLPLPPGPEWIQTQWELARRDASAKRPVLLILDEVQKVSGWSEVVKAHWDADRASRASVRVLLLGSSALLLTRGANESLAGRFFLHRCLHWSFSECSRAFGWDLERWIYFGGYPGAAPLAGDDVAFRAYVRDALIEPAIARDVLAMQTVAKPALLRQLFALCALYPAQILSYNKMLGQLQDAGNTTTLAHYLRLLESAFLTSGLDRFRAGQAARRGSSPKLIVWNNALITGLGLTDFEETRRDASQWGRLVENAVGAHLIGHLSAAPHEVSYWRERSDEVDFVVRAGRNVWAVEVKSGRPGRVAGLSAFQRRYPRARPLIVGTGGMPLEEFLSTPPSDIFK
jgi:predicted AAA+ superfamily ATPase